MRDDLQEELHALPAPPSAFGEWETFRSAALASAQGSSLPAVLEQGSERGPRLPFVSQPDLDHDQDRGGEPDLLMRGYVQGGESDAREGSLKGRLAFGTEGVTVGVEEPGRTEGDQRPARTRDSREEEGADYEGGDVGDESKGDGSASCVPPQVLKWFVILLLLCILAAIVTTAVLLS